MHFDWTLLQSFLAVAEHGSHSAAARALGTSQPTIGRHLAELQAQLELELLERSPKGYQLTSAGAELMSLAEDMRQSAAQISLLSEGRTAKVEGTVRVTASEVVATYLMPEVLPPLLDAEPELEIELVATNSTENLLLREADIAVRMVEPDQNGLIRKRLGGISIGLFAANSYLAQSPPFTGTDDLKQHRLVGYDRSELILKGMAEFGLNMDRHDFAFRCDNQVTYVQALAAGMGIGVCQRRVAINLGLVDLAPGLAIPPLPVWLTAHEALRSSARVRRVFDHLAEHLPKLF